MLSDGGFRRTKTHVMSALLPGRGVTMARVNLSAGAGTATELYLVNRGHDRDMQDARSSIKFRQFMQARQAGPIDSGAVTVTTESDWRKGEPASCRASVDFSVVRAAQSLRPAPQATALPLSTPSVNRGSLYRCAKSNFLKEQPVGHGRRNRGA